MFSFTSVSASCSFLKYLGTVQKRDHKEKREFFIQAPTVLKPGQCWNVGRPSADCIIQIYAADANGMTRFGVFVLGSSRHQKCTH